MTDHQRKPKAYDFPPCEQECDGATCGGRMMVRSSPREAWKLQCRKCGAWRITAKPADEDSVLISTDALPSNK